MSTTRTDLRAVNTSVAERSGAAALSFFSMVSTQRGWPLFLEIEHHVGLQREQIAQLQKQQQILAAQIDDGAMSALCHLVAIGLDHTRIRFRREKHVHAACRESLGYSQVQTTKTSNDLSIQIGKKFTAHLSNFNHLTRLLPSMGQRGYAHSIATKAAGDSRAEGRPTTVISNPQETRFDLVIGPQLVRPRRINEAPFAHDMNKVDELQCQRRVLLDQED